jgi:cold-inducible RNA-binding protein
MDKKLYVANLSYDMTDSDLQDLFKAHGTVRSARVIMDRDTGRSKGFGFIEMGSAEQAQAAIDALNGHENNGRRLTVHQARPREERAGSNRGLAGGNVRGEFGSVRSY